MCSYIEPPAFPVRFTNVYFAQLSSTDFISETKPKMINTDVARKFL